MARASRHDAVDSSSPYPRTPTNYSDEQVETKQPIASCGVLLNCNSYGQRHPTCGVMPPAPGKRNGQPVFRSLLPRVVGRLLVGQLQDSPKPGLVEPIAKLAHERRKAGLAGAVAWRDPLQSECVVQHVYDSLDLFA